MTRRTALAGGLTCAAAFAAGAGDGPASAKDDRCPTLSVAGELNCNADVLDRAAVDFGHVVRKQPRAVLKPASVADIAAVTRWAGSRGLKVAARGQGHSIYGRAMAEDGIVIDMNTIDTIHRLESDHIVVDAGATWHAVLNAALSRGLTPPVLTNYLGLSVGGTLAVGGIGGTTSRHGMQTDNVFELDVVTGDGRELTCSANQNTDLFDAVRGGLGQCAIITRAKLRLMPAPARVLRFQLLYPDLHSLTADQRRVLAEQRFDQLQGAIVPDNAGGWRYQLEGAVYHDGSASPNAQSVLAGLSDDRRVAVISDLGYLEDANTFARLENLLRSNGQWANPHPWWLTFVRGANAEQFAAELLQGLTHDDVGPFGRVTYYPMRTDALRTPLVRKPDEGVAFPVNIIRIPASNDRRKAEQMIANNRALYDRVRNAGGVLYPVSAFPMRGADWRDHFASTWPLLQEAKERYDPRHVLTPGYELF
jgi:cytokinin dehydrogenase